MEIGNDFQGVLEFLHCFPIGIGVVGCAVCIAAIPCFGHSNGVTVVTSARGSITLDANIVDELGSCQRRHTSDGQDGQKGGDQFPLVDLPFSKGTAELDQIHRGPYEHWSEALRGSVTGCKESVQQPDDRLV